MRICDQCGNEVPNGSDVCLYCGNDMSGYKEVDTVGNRSLLGPVRRKMAKGLVFVILGLSGATGSMRESLIPGIFFFAVFLGLFWHGAKLLMGVFITKCPHCSALIELGTRDDTVRCKNCGKRSVRRDQYLEGI